jgi:hypothetical protein
MMPSVVETTTPKSFFRIVSRLYQDAIDQFRMVGCQGGIGTHLSSPTRLSGPN